MKYGVWRISCIILVVGCGSDSPEDSPGIAGCESIALEISDLEQRLFGAEGELEPEVEVRSQLMELYAQFANGCHEDVRTAEMLFRRADLLRSAGKFQEAMTQLRDIHDHFPNFEKRSVCAFLVGFISEVELNDREQARTTYEQVVALHPDSRAAEWASQSLRYLDESQVKSTLLHDEK